jgi:hypothetical protein
MVIFEIADYLLAEMKDVALHRQAGSIPVAPHAPTSWATASFSLLECCLSDIARCVVLS